jgi:hypothetical protein
LGKKATAVQQVNIKVTIRFFIQSNEIPNLQTHDFRIYGKSQIRPFNFTKIRKNPPDKSHHKFEFKQHSAAQDQNGFSFTK